MKIKLSLLLFMQCGFGLFAQTANFTSAVYEKYEHFKEEDITTRRFKHSDIQPLIDRFASRKDFTISTVGTSIEGRDLRLISIGEGDLNVFFWSQMHGDESTATMAIFDMLNFLNSNEFEHEKSEILRRCTLHFLPMLNPDGAEVFQRRNALGIDVNRDALRLQSPEGRTLKKVRDSLEADFGFNLHDQSWYYNAERTEKPATISYLAPAYNYEKEVDSTRGNAMKVIAYMNEILQKYAPGQVGRYNDDFEPRAFGDNIQKWGTSTILIESGGFPNDKNKQEIRKLNFVSILSAVYAIATGEYATRRFEGYTSIPENDRKLFDLKIEKVSYPLHGKTYMLDLGIQQLEVELSEESDFWVSSRIIDQGDLSTYYGYETLEASELTLAQGKIYPRIFETMSEIEALNFWELMRQGYTYLRLKNIPDNLLFSPFPLHLVSENFRLPEEFRVQVGINPTFILVADGQPKYAVLNGFLYNLQGQEGVAKNTLIFR